MDHAPPSFQQRLRSIGLLGALGIALVLVAGNLLGATLVLLWASATRTPWRELGFVRGTNVARDVVLATLGGVALKLVLKTLVLPLLGAPDVNRTYADLAGNAAALPGMLLFVIVGGGFGEELIWRAFLFERLKILLGRSRAAAVTIVASTTILFAAAHLIEQGWPGATQAVFTGLAFGTAYWRLGRIWPVMIAHAAFDVAAVVMIYQRLELPVAHLVFH